jgi:hypothetical protein
MDLNALVGFGGIPLINALVAWVKTTFPKLPHQYLPSVAIAWSVILNVVLVQLTHAPYWQAVLVGVGAGLLASGLYQAAKVAVLYNRNQ